MSELTKVRKSVMEKKQILPDMAGQSGKVLTNDGNLPRWIFGRYVGELVRVSMDYAPPGCFALDGSRIFNGKYDFPTLANCGSRFIAISGNDLILADVVDFGRGKGSSGRGVGSFEIDTIQDMVGQINFYEVDVNYSDGIFTHWNWGPGRSYHNNNGTHGSSVRFEASRMARVSHENRPKSLTELVCIYHGVL